MGKYMKWDKKASYNIRRSTPVRAHLNVIGMKVLAEAESTRANKKVKYDIDSRQGARKPSGRWKVSIATANAHAMREEGRHNTLLKALTKQGRGTGTNRGK